MSNKRFGLKQNAIKARRQGKSIKEISKNLAIPQSTLSGWLRHIKLTKKQHERLQENWRNGLIKARKIAVKWHNAQKKLRIQIAHREASEILSKIDVTDKHILELALAMLYLGEGSKTQATSMGNSNPLILNFFIRSVEKIYDIDKKSLKCELHLRSDQNPSKAIDYWARELNLDKSRFNFVKDKRPAKTKTYPNYKGVCVVMCKGIAIQRRVVHLGEEFSKIAIAG